MVNQETLESMRAECKCERFEYCPLEEIVLHYHSSDRMFVQHKCIEKFKTIESSKQHKDIGWEKAYSLWVENGFAKAFGEAYKEGIKLSKLYKILFKT